MRILHATDTYGPTVGGIEVLVGDLAARQAEAGHDVTVLTRTPGPPVPPDEPVRVCRDPRAMRRLVGSADIVHAHVSAYSPLALRSAETAGRTRVPVVATVHSMWTGAWPLVRAVSEVRGWPELPIQWAAVSEAAAVPVRRVVNGRGVIVLPNAIDAARWTPAPAARTSADVTLVSVMRMTRRKRPLELLAMLRRVREDTPATVGLRAVLVGDGPLLASVRRAIIGRGLASWVTATGALDHQSIRGLYRTADIFVAPATLESFGIAALEARASGLAVAARAESGIADFVAHRLNGMLSHSDAQMAGQLVELCADRSLLAAMVSHNQTHRPAYDWSEVLWRNDYAYGIAMGAGAARSATVPSEVPSEVPSQLPSQLPSQGPLSGVRPESVA